ncbi:hypothetical protein AVEN_227966-1 [Araneus ventricosus]|uniref:Uncharacterized protein n=1 Tax=Araneus ventricosus TaxID=182803 RepID=A0A4Y2X1U0_ARAVE|nr:hypothetical protein AVEN_227966-1 [Araneus ventricosus]
MKNPNSWQIPLCPRTRPAHRPRTFNQHIASQNVVHRVPEISYQWSAQNSAVRDNASQEHHVVAQGNPEHRKQHNASQTLGSTPRPRTLPAIMQVPEIDYQHRVPEHWPGGLTVCQKLWGLRHQNPNQGPANKKTQNPKQLSRTSSV